MAEKRYLFTPGPTPAPPEVLAALAEPVLHHRGPDFREIYAECLDRLRQVLRTERDVLLFTASGTAAMESAVANLCSAGDRVLVASAGYFGERWGAIAEAYGCQFERLAFQWGEIPDPAALERRLAEVGPVRVVFLTQSETSTGVVADIEALTAVAKRAGALVAVDAISSLGAVPLETDAWGVDVVVSGSQKALMTPPGLALVAASPDAWAARQAATLPRFYLDWERTRAAQAKLDAPFTPATSLVVALNVALGKLLDAGLEAAFDRHIRLGRACRAGIRAMGLELFSPDDDSAAVVTAVTAPEGVDSGELVLVLRDRYGITLAPGQGPLKGRVFRIGHIGWFDVFDIVTALAGVELALAEAGVPIERGAAVRAALDAFAAAPTP
jgi:serine---pyruvate transaminase